MLRNNIKKKKDKSKKWNSVRFDIRIYFYKSYFKYNKVVFYPSLTAKIAVSKDFYTNNKKKKMDYK